MAKRVRFWAASIFILMAAATVRFYGIDWDGGVAAHPDERHLVGVAESLRVSRFLNVFRVAPDFAYGHVPVYVLALATGRDGADPLFVGRALAALFDVGTVALTLAVGRRIQGPRVGLLAAAFVAAAVLHVQQAHFYTVDVLLAFFSLGAVVSALRLSQRGRARDAVLVGVWAGLALGCKSTAALLVMPLGAACSVVEGRRSLRWRRGLQVGASALLVFACTNPFALLSTPVFLNNVWREMAIARGVLDVPYTRQYHGTWPYVYPISQQMLWGLGIPLAVVSFGGLVRTTVQATRRLESKAEWVLLMWALSFLAFTGALYAKPPRYLLPLMPVLTVYGARLILSLRAVTARRAVAFICLLATALHCLVFLTLYHRPHPWLAATAWFEANVPDGAVVAVEQWDHPLPLQRADVYEVWEIPIFAEDSGQEGLDKWEQVDAILGDADYIVIASRRGYGSLSRWPERYPLTLRYYRRLFDGDLGFEVVACFGRDPRLGPLAVIDDPTGSLPFSLPDACRADAPVTLRLSLDESLVVYDRPRTIIFRRTGLRE
jgi:4-amino-4-deoxy-L-arabinose transferase-like glycosyltransferase